MKNKVVSMNNKEGTVGVLQKIAGSVKDFLGWVSIDDSSNVHGLGFSATVLYPQGHDGKTVLLSKAKKQALAAALDKTLSKSGFRKLLLKECPNKYSNIEIISLPEGKVYKSAGTGTIAFTVNRIIEDATLEITGLFLEYILTQINLMKGESFCMYSNDEKNNGFFRSTQQINGLINFDKVPTPELNIDWTIKGAVCNGNVTYNRTSEFYVEGITLQLKYCHRTETDYVDYAAGEKDKFISILLDRFNSEEGRDFIKYCKKLGLDYIAFYPDNDGKGVHPKEMCAGKLNITVSAFLSLSWDELKAGIASIARQVKETLPDKDTTYGKFSKEDRVGFIMGANYNNLRIYPKPDNIVFEKNW